MNKQTHLIENKYIHYKTKAAFDQDLSLGIIDPTSIVFINDTRLIWTHNVFFGSSTVNPIPYVKQKYSVLEQAEYEALTEYDDDTIYFVLEPREEINWTFGGTFPITFTGSDGIGTFPIILK